MLKKLIILSLILLTACGGNESNNENPKNEVPKALQEEGGSKILGRYRSNDELTEELYQELVSKNTELKNLETDLENFNAHDTLNIFYNYDGKSEDYYQTANNKANSIKDSILKNKIIVLLKMSNEKYAEKTAGLNQLVKTIHQKKSDINDYHNALKIVLTLPIIKKYQDENLPKKSPFEKVIKDENLLIEKIKKNTPEY
ncbi:hypothetical protein [Flavobacterium sp. CF136]|uniref:hypothetical protein n=1 Tax=Flavobacterium sp. (strain CF136) TaxID=1144313 RepID=UPI0003172A6E|nr:hypothetical protein [Flavobacterium sp. CF136]